MKQIIAFFLVLTNGLFLSCSSLANPSVAKMNNGNQDESFARSFSKKKSPYSFEKNYSHIIDKGLSCFKEKVVPYRHSNKNEELGKDNKLSQVGNYD